MALIAADDGDSRPSPTQDIENIASKALIATQAGLAKAMDDAGLKYTFYLLTQLVLAAREPDWQQRLNKFGIQLDSTGSVFDLTSEFQNSIDDYIRKHAKPTDISEIAQKAVTEAISALATPKSQSLFGDDQNELKDTLKGLSTKKGFSQLGTKFFGRFMSRFLNFYLSRVTAAEVGKAPIKQIGELTSFNAALDRHCSQSAEIVSAFCGEWYSKTNFKEGINLTNSSGFMAVALKKLQAELSRQGAEG